MDIEQLKEQLLSDPDVRRMVGRRAYEIYLERRGSHAAHPAEDWLRAESEILPRLIEHMIERNRQAIGSSDAMDPVAARAAEHFEEELQLAETRVAEPSPAAKAGKKELLNQNAERIASTAAEPAPVKKTAAKKAPARKAPAAKAPAKKAAAKKAPAAKAPAKKAAAKKAPAKPKKAE